MAHDRKAPTDDESFIEDPQTMADHAEVIGSLSSVKRADATTLPDKAPRYAGERVIFVTHEASAHGMHALNDYMAENGLLATAPTVFEKGPSRHQRDETLVCITVLER